MAVDDDIRPGEVSPGQALFLSAAVATAYRTEEAIAHWGDPEQLDLPIKLTSCDTSYTPARCAWTLRTWNSSGARIDHPNGRTGTVTASPAMLIGNGATPPAAFPIDTWGKPTRTAESSSGTSIGLPIEVDWNCACAAGGSGAGSGGGGTVVVTDCGDLSTVLTITFHDTAGTSGADGTVLDLEWDGTKWVVTGAVVLDTLVDWQIECVSGNLIQTVVFTATGPDALNGDTAQNGGTSVPGFGSGIGLDSDPSVQIAYTIAEG